jgi:hypothetical protein
MTPTNSSTVSVFSVLKMASFLTNPYNNFQAANSKEYNAVEKGAKQDFRPKTNFDLIPGTSNSFLVEIEKYSVQFGFGALLNVPTARDVNSTDANTLNTITYKDPVTMTETWNKFNDKFIAKNANECKRRRLVRRTKSLHYGQRGTR